MYRRFHDNQGRIGAFYSVSAAIGLPISQGFSQIHLCVSVYWDYWHDLFNLHVDNERSKLKGSFNLEST